MKNWRTTTAGIVAIVIAGLVQLKYLTPEQGVVISGAIIGIIGLVSKDSNVTGGSIPQASPPGVALKSDALGVVAAVDAIKVPSYEEERVKKMAEEVLTAPSTIEDALKPKIGY